MKLKVGDKIYCKKNYSEYVERDNYYSKLVEKCEEFYDDYDLWVDDLLHIYQKKTIFDYIKSFVKILFIAPVIILFTMLFVCLFFVTYKKVIVFKKNKWYYTYFTQNIPENSSFLSYIAIGNTLSGDKIKRFYFKKRKNPLNNYRFRHPLFNKYFFNNIKELRKEKLEKLNFN